MPTTITDKQFIDAVYLWNLTFFQSRVKAGNRDEDIIKLNSINANELSIKEKAKEYLEYWKDFKYSIYYDVYDYVINNLRDYMENTTFTIPDEENDAYYNNTPLLCD